MKGVSFMHRDARSGPAFSCDNGSGFFTIVKGAACLHAYTMEIYTDSIRSLDGARGKGNPALARETCDSHAAIASNRLDVYGPAPEHMPKCRRDRTVFEHALVF
jgi:hypothetical protein